MEWKIIHIDETDSTNSWLRKGLTTDEQSDANMVVWAEYQTAGRGCGTNRWESERGKNLTFSVAIHPKELPATQQFHISMAVSLAIASSSTQPLVDHALALIGVKDYFDIILSGADVHHKKPDPEIYCRVLEMAGIPPENAVAIEDTASGVVAAQGAGLYCFGFHNPDSGSQDLNHADKVIESLKELPGYFAAMIGEE